MSKDFFEHKADVYDADNKRVSNVENIANVILKIISLNRKMHLLDFGSGTDYYLSVWRHLYEKLVLLIFQNRCMSSLKRKETVFNVKFLS